MPIDKNTPLHVASVSKTLTAMAMMKLISRENKIV
jgi:CubicO group peptidase (beta-lactamase class C family)